MPFNGTGTYTPAAAPNFPAVSGNAISSTYYNAVINDIATALSNCLTRDGQGKPSANIDWNNKNLTNIASLAATTLALTTALDEQYGGTGVDASAAANGRTLIGNGSGFTLANITGGAGITVTNGSGTIQISAVGGGAVSSVDASGGTTGFSFTGGPITTAGTLTMAGTLAVANGGTGSTTAANARAALSAAKSGAVTASDITMTSARLLGRITAATGAIEEVTAGATLLLAAGSLGVASVPNALTINNGGAGSASGQIFNGSSALTISYNTIGAQPSTPRIQTVASAATVTPTFSDDEVIITTQAVALALANPTGTAAEGYGIVLRIKDNGTARAITYGTQYRAIGITLPTTTTINKTLYLGMIYNATDTKWDVVSISQEA